MQRGGTTTSANVLNGIACLKRSTEFRLFHHARAEAVGVQQALAALPGVRRVEIAGSLRRRREIIRDLDFVVEYVGDESRDAFVGRLGDASRVDGVVATPGGFGLAWVRATGAAPPWAELLAR